MARQDKSWQAPPFSEDPSKRMSWIEEACVGEAESWLKGQTAYSDIPKGLDIISGKLDARANQARSDLVINHAKFILRKIIAILADVRAAGMYTSDAKFYKKKISMMNKTATAVALEAQFPRCLRQTLQYMSITACGYMWPRWTRLGGFGEPGVEFLPLGLMDVLPVQMPATNNLQGCYSITICEFIPVFLAHAKNPAFQSELLPIARRRYTSTVSARRMDLAERFKYGDSSDNWDNLYCEIRHTFIRDLSINETGMPIPMGSWIVDPDNGQASKPATSWSYMVPYIGQEIPAGTSPGGVQKTRKAEIEDCMIYPQMRLIQTSKGMKQPLYDGPAKDWSNRFPLAKYCSDDWVTEPSGFSMVHDIYSMERSRQTLERGMDQIAKARLDPSISYDRQAGLNDGTAQALDPFQERGRVGVDGDPSKVFATTCPEELLSVPAWIPENVKYLLNSQDAQLGLNELTNLQEFKASLQGGEAVDKALNLVGPLVRDISSGMEASTIDIWEILKYMIPQFMTTRRAIQYVGIDNITPETFDFDPEKLIPSHGADEVAYAGNKWVIPPNSQYTDPQRAKMFASNLRLVTVPHRLLNITQMEEQLKYLQLFRGGFPIAPHDVAKKLNIENYGEIDGDTMFERWFNWKKLEIKLKAEAAQLESSLMPHEPAATTGSGPAGSGGRPPSGKKAPKVKQKTGGPSGPRTTVTES